MAETEKRIANGEIIENPDKRTISQGNKELRKEQAGEDDHSVQDADEQDEDSRH